MSDLTWDEKNEDRVQRSIDNHDCPMCPAKVGIACDPHRPIAGNHMGRKVLVPFERKDAE